jgi:hypothetical protein
MFTPIPLHFTCVVARVCDLRIGWAWGHFTRPNSNIVLKRQVWGDDPGSAIVYDDDTIPFWDCLSNVIFSVS